MANYKKKSNAWKGVAVFLAIAVAAAYIVPSAILNQWNPAKWGEQTSEQSDEIFGGGMVIGENSGDQAIRLTSNTLLPAQYAEYGVDEQAVTAYTITAEVQPSTALQDIDYDYHFVNASSDWATGKTVSDYVTISQDENTLTVSCSQAFGEQIAVDISSRFNPDISTSCTLDYVKGIESVDVSVTGNEVWLGGDAAVMDFDITYGTGTIYGEFGIDESNGGWTLEGTTEFNNLLEAENNRYMDSFLNDRYPGAVDYSFDYSLAAEYMSFSARDEEDPSAGYYAEFQFDYADGISTSEFDGDGPDHGYTPEITDLDTTMLQYALRWAAESNSGSDCALCYYIEYTYGDTVLWNNMNDGDEWVSGLSINPGDLEEIPTATGINTDKNNIVFLPV